MKKTSNYALFRFGKSERLYSRKSISELFSSGESLLHYPFRIFWLGKDNDNSSLFKLAISVPRKKFKKAVDRNRIKRYMRESYRLNKLVLHKKLQQQNRKVEMIIIYIADQQFDFNYIKNKMLELFSNFIIDDSNNQDNI